MYPICFFHSSKFCQCRFHRNSKKSHISCSSLSICFVVHVMTMCHTFTQRLKDWSKLLTGYAKFISVSEFKREVKMKMCTKSCHLFLHMWTLWNQHSFPCFGPSETNVLLGILNVYLVKFGQNKIYHPLTPEAAATNFVFTVYWNHHYLFSIDACCVTFAPQMMMLCTRIIFLVFPFALL